MKQEATGQEEMLDSREDVLMNNSITTEGSDDRLFKSSRRSLLKGIGVLGLTSFAASGTSLAVSGPTVIATVMQTVLPDEQCRRILFERTDKVAGSVNVFIYDGPTFGNLITDVEVKDQIGATRTSVIDLFELDEPTKTYKLVPDSGTINGKPEVFVVTSQNCSSSPPKENSLPTATFTYTGTPQVGDSLTFDASDSLDTDGTIVGYEWNFGDGTTGTGQLTTHTFTAPGDYDVTLTVTDDAGATATETQTVSIVVFAKPLIVNGTAYLPQDLNNDGKYEDIDGDGAVVKGKDTFALARLINAYRRGELTLSEAQINALDFNGDGALTGADNGAYNQSPK